MSCKLREFHAVQFMSFLQQKRLSVRLFLCGKVSRNHIPFGTGLSAILIFLLPPFPRRTSLALANSSNLTSWIYLFLGNRRDGREVCSSKRSPNSVCRQSRVSCSIVLWCPNQLPLILRKPSNTEWYKCLLLLHGNKSLRLMLSKKKFDVQTMQRMHIAMELSQIFSTTKCVGFCVYKEFIEEKQPQVHLLTSMDTQAHHYFEKCQKRFRNQSIKAFKV